jgi:MFS family permease
MRTTFNRPAKLFLTATVLYGIAYSFWELFFNLYMLSSGVGKDTLGLIRAISPLTALLLGLPLGKLADRIGYRKSLIIGLTIGLLGMALQIILQAHWQIILMGAVQGAGLMLYRVATPPFIMESSSEQNRTLYFSLNFSLLTFAGMVGNLIAGQLPTLAAHYLGIQDITAAAYQLVILAGICLGATCLIPLLMIKGKNLHKLEDDAPPSPILSIKELFSRKIIRQLFVINMFVGLGAALLIPYLNVFFREEHLMSDQALGLLYSLSSLLVVIGSISAPWLARKMHSKIVATNVTQAVSIVFLLLLGFSPWLWLAQISFLLRTVFMQLSSPLLENFAMEVSPPGQQSTIAGIRGMGWQVGQAVGLYASGLVQIKYGFDPLFITTAVLYLISIILAANYFRPMEKELARTHA